MGAPGPRSVIKNRAKKSSPKNLWTPRGLVGESNKQGSFQNVKTSTPDDDWCRPLPRLQDFQFDASDFPPLTTN